MSLEMFWYGVVFVLGAIVGSFLNVVIYRLHTGRSLSGRSHCMSCGKMLTWYELFPLFSYISQKGVCRGCGAYIPPRYFVVELLTACLYVLVWHIYMQQLLLSGIFLVLMSLFVVILFYDIRHTIIPDEYVLATLACAVVLVGYEFFLVRDLYIVFPHIAGGFIASFFFWLLWYVSKGRWVGLGDAKLAFPLGIIVGISEVFSLIVLSFWIGAGISLTLLGIERASNKWKTHLRFLSTPLTIKSEVPFAPFLILGFLFVQLFHADIFNITYEVLALFWL